LIYFFSLIIINNSFLENRQNEPDNRDIHKENKKIFLGLDLVTLTAVAGGILLSITLVCAICCLVFYCNKKTSSSSLSGENKSLMVLSQPQQQQHQHTYEGREEVTSRNTTIH